MDKQIFQIIIILLLLLLSFIISNPQFFFSPWKFSSVVYSTIL